MGWAATTNAFLCLFPSLFMAHEFEEIVLLGAWKGRHTAYFSTRNRRLTPYLAFVSTSSFSCAVAEEWFLLLVITAAALFLLPDAFMLFYSAWDPHYGWRTVLPSALTGTIIAGVNLPLMHLVCLFSPAGWISFPERGNKSRTLHSALQTVIQFPAVTPTNIRQTWISGDLPCTQEENSSQALLCTLPCPALP
jgi:hypothetical protein